MTFVELQEEAEGLCEIWGYNNTPRAPDWFALTNQAYRDFCWDTDAIRGPAVTFPTVIGTSEYNLRTVAADSRDWKFLLDLYYNGAQVYPTDEAVLRRDNPLWLADANGTPIWRWMPRSNIVRLHPAPDAVQTVTAYGVRAPAALSAATDTPVVHDRYHMGIPIRAAWLHARKYAKSPEQFESLNIREREWQAYVDEYKNDHAEGSGVDGWRNVAPVQADRVYV